MRKNPLPLILAGCFAVMIGLCCSEPARAQLRVPPTPISALAMQQEDDVLLLEGENVPATPPQTEAQVLPVQHVVAQDPSQTQAPQPVQQTVPQPVAQPQVTMAQPQVVVQTAAPQIQPQVMMQAAPMQAPMMQAASMPGTMSGAIVVPVTVPQYVTYTPQPVTMMVNRPAQLVIPQGPAPMQPMYDPMLAMQIQQQMMMQQQMMQQQMMMQAPPRPQQPIPVKMILPDGSTVSIKHYVPGHFFKNVWRAVTP